MYICDVKQVYFSSLHMFNVICLERNRMYNKLYEKFDSYEINKIFYLKKTDLLNIIPIIILLKYIYLIAAFIFFFILC